MVLLRGYALGNENIWHVPFMALFQVGTMRYHSFQATLERTHSQRMPRHALPCRCGIHWAMPHTHTCTIVWQEFDARAVFNPQRLWASRAQFQDQKRDGQGSAGSEHVIRFSFNGNWNHGQRRGHEVAGGRGAQGGSWGVGRTAQGHQGWKGAKR